MGSIGSMGSLSHHFQPKPQARVYFLFFFFFLGLVSIGFVGRRVLLKRASNFVPTVGRHKI